MKLTGAPASVAEADDPGQPKYATLARRPSMRVIGTLWPRDGGGHDGRVGHDRNSAG
jgi:hypothetical protein